MQKSIWIGLVWVLATVAMSGVANAQDADTNMYENNLINTLHYRNAAHTFYTSLNLSAPLIRTEDIWSGSGKTDHYTRNSLSSTLDFAYGLTDDWQLGFSENYLFSYNSTQTFAGGSNSYKENGASDPTLQVSYRYAGGLTGKKFATVYLNVTPAIGKEQNATTAGTTGNNLNADTVVAVGLNYYWVQGVHEFYLNPFLDYHSSGTYNNDTTSSTNDPYWVYGVSGTYRYHINEKYAVSANVNLTAPYDITYNDPATTESDTASWQVAENLSLNCKLSESWLLSGTLSNTEYGYLVTYANGNNLLQNNFQSNNVTVQVSHTY